MKTLEQLGIRVPEILLPQNIDVKTWSVIACDQYTQSPDYWKRAELATGGRPSTLNLILPEVYLNDKKEERINKIRRTMTQYLEEGIFSPAKKCFVYVERKTAYGRTRRGLVAQIDLDSYEWKPFSSASIRATEATIVERIPPRKEIRKGAPLELPHIMLLVNDKERLLVEECGKAAKAGGPLYKGELMCNGGQITGWEISDEAGIARITDALNRLAQKNTAADGSVFLFAVGDGNHSLATAKAVWDEYREELRQREASKEEIENSPVRYALVEIVNIYDEGLTFEPIHRVLFNIDSQTLVRFLAERLEGTATEARTREELASAVKKSSAGFGFAFLDESGTQRYVLLSTNIRELAVSRLQPELDKFLKEEAGTKKEGNPPEIDYIHGEEEVFRLGAGTGATGILLPPIEKDSFFETISSRGPLPRKSFSMGEADEKRFYLECRTLFFTDNAKN